MDVFSWKSLSLPLYWLYLFPTAETFAPLVMKIKIFSIVIGSKNSYLQLFHFPWFLNLAILLLSEIVIFMINW